MRCVVVGAGLCGMATALGLARAGVTDSGAIDVELIEAGDHLGGVARGLRFACQRFCPGPQYLWGFGPRGVECSDDDDGAATALLAALGIDVDTIAMPADFERLQIGSASWTAAADVIDDPTLTVGDRRFLATLMALGRAGRALERETSFRLDGPAMIASIAKHGALDDVACALRHRNDSVADVARRCGASSSTLRRVLYSQGIFAERLGELSVVLFAAAWRHLQRPLRVPVGGVVALIDSIVAETQRRVAVTTGERVVDIDAGGDHVVVSTTQRQIVADHVVFAGSPGALPARLRTGPRARFAASNTIGVRCLAIDTDASDRAALAHRNFSRFVDDDDVDFARAATTHARTINFTAPVLNGLVDIGAAAVRQALCVFYPLGRDDDDDVVGAAAEADVVTALRSIVGHDVEIAERLALPPTVWTQHFGAHDGAVYGRRLTSSSMRRSQIAGLPARVHLAHSGAGIPGVLGCLQLAAVTVRDVLEHER